MKTKYIIIGLVILLMILFFVKNKEHAGSTSQKISNEAIQNISKVYADTKNTVSFNNLRITGKTTLNGIIDIPKWKGMITMWYGNLNDIPVGWALCDGTKGTPDLRGKFVISIGKGKDSNNKDLTERKMSDTGGSETHTLSIKEIPSHRHYFGRDWYGGSDTEGVDLGNTDGQGSSDFSGQTSYTGGDSSITSAPGFKTDDPSTWATKPHENMPPFYALAYIMRIS